MFAPWLRGPAPDAQRGAPVRRALATLSARAQLSSGGTTTSCCSATPRTPRTSRSGQAPSWPWKMPSSLARESARLGDRAIFRTLAGYQADRQTEALRLQNAARNSMEWFENVRRYVHLEPEQFAYSLLTRSQRVESRKPAPARSHLSGRRGALVRQPRANGASSGRHAAARLHALPPARHGAGQPHRRLADGHVQRGRWHAQRFSSRAPGQPALGGAGLVFTEMVCVSPEARISIGCTGLYNDEHVDAWRASRISCTNGHARSSACSSVTRGARAAPEDVGGHGPAARGRATGPCRRPRRCPGAQRNQVPREMTRDDMDRGAG